MIGCAGIMALCPLLVLYFWVACDSFKCSITAPLTNLDTLYDHFPQATTTGFALYFSWLLFQAVLYNYVPAKIGYGQMTPAGFKLPYIVNGLRAWIITHVLYIGLSCAGYFPASIIAENWGPLLVAANTYGYFLTFFAFAKAHWFPSHAEDRKFSSSWVYDLFMGIEFNPRFGEYFDFKLFHNGRPGIIAWTLINYSFAAAQYNQIGYVTNSMILLNFLHLVYVLDFFYHEVYTTITPGLVLENY